MALTEPPEVQDYWAKLTSDTTIVKPTFDRAKFDFDLEGRQPRFCCLYRVREKKDFCYVVSQEKLDNVPSGATTHIKAMNLFLITQNLFAAMPEKRKCNYIVGFYYDVGIRKATSCVNYFFGRTRNLMGDIAEDFERDIFPKIDNYFRTHITQCQGTTKKGAQCKRVIKNGFNCYHHDG